MSRSQKGKTVPQCTSVQWGVYWHWWPRAKSSVCDYRRECLLPMGRRAPQWHPSIQYKTNHTNCTLCALLYCTWSHRVQGTTLICHYCTATALQASKLPAATTWVSRWAIFWFKLLSSHLCGWIGLHLSIIPSQCHKMIHYQWIQGAIFALDLHGPSERKKTTCTDRKENQEIYPRSGKTCCVCRAGEVNTAIQVVSSTHPITNTAGTLPYSCLLPYARQFVAPIHWYYAHQFVSNTQLFCTQGASIQGAMWNIILHFTSL